MGITFWSPWEKREKKENITVDLGLKISLFMARRDKNLGKAPALNKK
ncbi:MAG: hypothetical protein KGH54_01990 [Candidatus Micrarchaeota archaeon]|nr:hypothetical protein [Candidatus Micrarchaeota archaeon]